jgi:AraC-like DNA-binding protein
MIAIPDLEGGNGIEGGQACPLRIFVRMKLTIKNMVCNRCKQAVKGALEDLGLTPSTIELGEVELAERTMPEKKLQELRDSFKMLGFELVDDKRSRIITRIKSLIINLVHHAKEENRLKYSEYITGDLHYDYPYLSRLFSEVEGITIEHYIINQKIERAKELLVYDELNISELADELGYSSVAHLSAQFKKVTGMTPSQFKALHHKSRKPLDEVGKQM